MTMLAEWTYSVEAGKIAEFARAVGASVLDRVPPTFAMAVGAEAVERLLTSILPLDRKRAVHGEQAFDYHAPIRAGMTLRCRADLVSDVVKPVRAGGEMRVVTVGITHRDAASGAVVLGETMTIIEKAATPPHPNSPPQRGREVPGEPGQSPASVTFGPITRTDLVRYAGASGDFNPLHHDPDYARAAGLPDVMAHGMYSAGLVGAQVERWLGVGCMTRYAVRFRAPVWVGDRLLLMCDRTEAGDLTLTLRRGDGIVLSATAHLATKDR